MHLVVLVTPMISFKLQFTQSALLIACPENFHVIPLAPSLKTLSQSADLFMFSITLYE